MTAAVFEPRFYERAAQRHLAALAGEPVFMNVPWGLTGAPATRHEIDAMLARDGRVIPAEVKAHQVKVDTAEEVIARYGRLGFRDVVVVAPDFTLGAAALLGGSSAPKVEAVRFLPALEEIAAFYAADWHACVPGWVQDSLATGGHHVRFLLTTPSVAGHLVIGQPRSRIYDAAMIARIVSRLPSPPARVLWTPQRFTIPRDLIARRSRVTALGGFLPVDIDGDRLHRAYHACQTGTADAACSHCLRHALREHTRLAAVLPEATWMDVLRSGGRGLHAYLLDDAGLRAHLLRTVQEQRIRIDVNVSVSPKATIALPGSLHAGTMLPVTPPEPAPSMCRNTGGRCRGIVDEDSSGRLTAPNPRTTGGTHPGAPAQARSDPCSQGVPIGWENTAC
ncbi:MAG: hypothetical protein ACRDYA_20590 [Egibacteraceae bacterium]